MHADSHGGWCLVLTDGWDKYFGACKGPRRSGTDSKQSSSSLDQVLPSALRCDGRAAVTVPPADTAGSVKQTNDATFILVKSQKIIESLAVPCACSGIRVTTAISLPPSAWPAASVYDGCTAT